MINLIEEGSAPRGAVKPRKIDKEGLFKLDVDDDIWQDIGLDDNELEMPSMPKWLVDGQVREGIKNLLELDRCMEEEKRLKLERCAIQEWMIEEWNCVESRINSSGECNHSLENIKIMFFHQMMKMLYISYNNKGASLLKYVQHGKPNFAAFLVPIQCLHCGDLLRRILLIHWSQSLQGDGMRFSTMK